MSKIRVLDEHTINKIAAGEVIENPASVVKELVENALDAGATEITVEIKGGGRQLIRISDNGCGMTSDDAVLCLERHATSKIRDVEDIQELITMGFRGEAIPSIASISKFTILTCPHKENVKNTDGTMVLVEGGQILACSPAVRSPGTTIEVKSLFFNIPVRKKFQKSPSYDIQEIVKILSMLSLGYPNIKFELISDQKQLLDSSILPIDHSFQEKLGYRIETIIGKDFFSSLCPISFQNDLFSLEGFIGLPTHHRANRTGQYLFINQRAVQSPLVSFALREGYGPAMPTNRYPICVLHLRLPGSLIDVNVHPQKKEVRLRQEQHLKELIISAVQQAIQQGHLIEEPLMTALSTSSFVPNFSSDYEKILFPLESDKETLFLNPVSEESHLQCKTPSFTIPSFEQEIPAFESFRKPFKSTCESNKIDTSPSQPVFQFIPKKQTPSILAILKGYILLNSFSLQSTFAASLYKEDGLYILNQHTAYARLYYERLMKKGKETHKQPLLIPITLEFSAIDSLLLQDYLPVLNDLGFSIREFGNYSFAIDAIPDLIKQEELENYLLTLISDLKEFQDNKRLQREKEKHLALTACRHASRANKHLSNEEAQALIDQLAECQIPLQCPLGRPTITYLSYQDLAQLFQK